MHRHHLSGFTLEKNFLVDDDVKTLVLWSDKEVLLALVHVLAHLKAVFLLLFGQTLV